MTELFFWRLSPQAQRVFITADLFGEGGKSFNAEFAALILDTASELLYHDWHGFECRDHLRKLAEELNNYANSQ
jgi:hypothetical protein